MCLLRVVTSTDLAFVRDSLEWVRDIRGIVWRQKGSASKVIKTTGFDHCMEI